MAAKCGKFVRVRLSVRVYDEPDGSRTNLKFVQLDFERAASLRDRIFKLQNATN